jgi:hypothetical protein
MAGVLFGEEGVGNIKYLSAELRRKTLELARRIDNNDYPHYTPWLCIRPLLTKPMSQCALCYINHTPGAILTSTTHLKKIESFLEENHDLTLSNLIGSREDWKILVSGRRRKSVTLELTAAIDFMLAKSNYLNDVYTSLVDMVIPLRQSRARGWSCQYARGAVFLGFPRVYSQLDLALDLAHEMGHQALALLQSSDALIASDWDAPVYSEVRKTNRPAFQSLHAAAAIAFMVKLAKDAEYNDYVHPEFSYPLTVALHNSVLSLRQSCKFTSLGASLMDDFDLIAEI